MTHLPLLESRPKTRGDCEGGARPCPYVGCRYNTSIDVRGSRVVEQALPVDGTTNCALDYADEGGVILEVVGAALGITRERARQLEARALERLGHRIREENAVAAPQPMKPRFLTDLSAWEPAADTSGVM